MQCLKHDNKWLLVNQQFFGQLIITIKEPCFFKQFILLLIIN